MEIQVEGHTEEQSTSRESPAVTHERNDGLSYQHFIRGKNKYLVCTFNSLGEKWGFEWVKSVREVGYSGLHLRAQPRTWYHYCISDVLKLLNEYKPDVLVGSSMGGYAALLFGALTNTKARAFGPQTTLEDIGWDRRWQHEWVHIRNNTKYPELLDLAKLDHHPETHIYYCSPVVEDRRHAERIPVKITARGCEYHDQAGKNLQPGIFD